MLFAMATDFQHKSSTLQCSGEPINFVFISCTVRKQESKSSNSRGLAVNGRGGGHVKVLNLSVLNLCDSKYPVIPVSNFTLNKVCPQYVFFYVQLSRLTGKIFCCKHHIHKVYLQYAFSYE